MKMLDVTAAERKFRATLRQGEQETVVLTRAGRPVAALVPIKGIDAETFSLSTNRKFLSLLRRSLRQLDAGRSVSFVEMKRRFSRDGKKS